MKKTIRLLLALILLAPQALQLLARAATAPPQAAKAQSSAPSAISASSAGSKETSALPSASQVFSKLGEDYWDALMRLSPLGATFNNYPRYNDLLDDNSSAGRAKEVEEMTKFLTQLHAVDRSQLSDAEKVSWDIMERQINDDLEGQKHKFWQWNVDHIDGPQSWIPAVVETAQPMKTAADAEALLSRLKAMPNYFQNQVNNLKEGVPEGRIAARIAVEKAIQQLEGLIKTPPDQGPYDAATKRLPDDLRKQYEPKILAAVKDDVNSAYTLYLRFLKDEYLSKTRSNDKPGLSYLPGGPEAYRYLIHFHTTVDLSAEQIHQIGLDELKGIHEEMDAIAKKRGYKGNTKSFLENVRRDPNNFFKTREEVQKTAESLVAKAQAKLHDFFGTLPKTSLVVKPVEEYKEKNEPAAFYFPPPDDLSRPGIYFINTYQPETRPRFSMTSLAAHEGVPGHHLQLALALEHRDFPAFRRNASFTAYVEGWALYCERLADDMGLYSDDLSRLGMLSDQGLRASRLVVDTGIHAMGWSRKQAIEFMKENTAMSEEEITTEVDRYIVWPGQALAYKIGQREISDIRRESQKALGLKFDIRAFHDAVLKNGAVPLPLLRHFVLEKS